MFLSTTKTSHIVTNTTNILLLLLLKTFKKTQIRRVLNKEEHLSCRTGWSGVNYRLNHTTEG